MQLEERRSGSGHFTVCRSIYIERGISGYWSEVSAPAPGFCVFCSTINLRYERRSFISERLCSHEVARTRLREPGVKYEYLIFWGTLVNEHRE